MHEGIRSQFCKQCNDYFLYPRTVCPRCGRALESLDRESICVDGHPDMRYKKVGEVESLEELLAWIKQTEREMIDLRSLPTFGGERPTGITGAWSWDSTHVLYGEDWDDLKIVTRQFARDTHYYRRFHDAVDGMD